MIRGWLPEPLSNVHADHWRKRERKLKAARVMAWASAKQAQWQPIRVRARLSITLVFPQQRRRDIDNLYARCKGLVDGLKEWFVDDSTEWLDLRVEACVEPGVKETRLVLEAI